MKPTSRIWTLLFLLLPFLVGLSSRAQAVPAAPPWGSNYQLVWSQDFTVMTADSQLKVNGGTTLTTGNTWISHYSNGGDDTDFINPIGHDHPFGIDGTGSGSNFLTIRAQQDASNANGANGVYTSGTLSSQDVNGTGFAQKYGYFEASIWVPNVPGATNNDAPNTHPAFWLLAHNPGASGGYAEIDATESYGNWGTGPNQSPAGNPNFDSMTWHDWFASTSSSNNSYIGEPTMTTGYHQYGVDVEPTGITWYFDRQAVWTAPIYPDAQVPLGVLLTLGLGGGNYNNSSNTGYNWNLTPNPCDMKVQYVAVWASPSSPNYTGGTNLIANGTYKIASQSSSLALAASGTSNGSSVVQQTYTSAATQQWTLTNLGNNVVELVSSGTNEALEAPGATTTNGAYLDVSAYTSATSQQWTVVAASTGYYELVNVNSGLEVNVAGSSNSSGAPICQWTAGNYSNGVWSLTPVSTTPTYALTVTNGTGSGTYAAGAQVTISANAAPSGYQFTAWTGNTSALANASASTTVVTMSGSAVAVTATYSPSGGNLLPNGTYKIVSQLSGLAVAASGTTNGSSVVQQTYTSAATQQWTLTNLGNNVVELVSSGTSEALEVPGASTTLGVNLDVASYTSGTNQQWQIVSVGGGYYEIVNVNSGDEINDSFNSTSSGNPLCQWTAGNYANGVWSFTAVSGGGGGGSPIVYQDGFARGTIGTPVELNGTHPDTVNTNNNIWTTNDGNNSGATSYWTNGTYAESASWMPYAYLPVNGSSGVTLDGTKNFTLSASVTGNMSSGRAGIYLANSPQGVYGSTMVAESLIDMSANEDYFWGPGNNNFLSATSVPNASTTTHTITLSYSATTHQMSFSLDGTATGVTVSITAAQISATTIVALGMDSWNGGNGSPGYAGAGNIKNFTLSVGP